VVRGPENLTGVWQGLFSYPRRYRATGFTAMLIETGSGLTGSTTELAVTRPRGGMTVLAIISGHRNDAEVTFTKQYEGPEEPNHSIEYEGTLSPGFHGNRRALVYPWKLGWPLPHDPFRWPTG
jgi:hypothetical protein